MEEHLHRLNSTHKKAAGAISITSLLDEISNAAAANTARLHQITLAAGRLEAVQAELSCLLSQKEDVNLAEAIASLHHQEAIYQATLEADRRAISALNLFDMMR